MASEHELLIASVTLQNLERGVLWFKENHAAIKKARRTNPWWRDNTLFFDKDLVVAPSLVIRQLIDLGYERAAVVRGKGLFAVRGGIVEVWPVNAEKPYLIEFYGNIIAAIERREPTSGSIEARPRYYRGLASIENLPLGNYVVHIDHGIGIFGGVSSEKPNCLVIEYAAPRSGAKPDRLFVPRDQEDRLSPYVGFTTPVVHRLGGTLWLKTRRRAREETEKMARSLLALYAKRRAARRGSQLIDQTFIRELAATCPFEETEGQVQAEEEIMKDLIAPRPMDRLLVADVGFGKTEVAIRASAAAISAGKQVVVLAPTTVLAVQHERTFKERLANLPIAVEMFTRLTASKDATQMLQKLADGKIDCVIGTHRLFSGDVKFKNLGLIIIDEEQRFGVKQKECFKELRAEVDILALSATPIPRTLSLALAKIRDISRIDTPPAGRVATVTAVLPYGEKLIREAIRCELARGGQVYFLHNRIETIGAAQKHLEMILRSLSSGCDRNRRRREAAKTPRIGIVHGRMREKELIKVMDAFRHKEIDILIATTIIENGLDISSANTLIVDDATRLGLAQAHQLRGRIGRGQVRAFAYFLYRPQRLTDTASQRLDTLKEYTDLGSGYDIALRDMEIRGAGNVLGREQSGTANKVGLNLYCQMLSEAVAELE